MAPSTATSTLGDTDKQIFIGKGDQQAWLTLALGNRHGLVTGATNGIGRATALGLARLGAEVVIIGRDSARIDATLAMLRDATGRDDAAAVEADLSSQWQVRQAAGEFSGRFDLLVRSHDGEVHVFDLGTAYVAGAIEWGQFLHDPRHTSNYATPVPSGGSLPEPGPAAPARLPLAQNIPNPFRPPTRIAYELAARGRARLEIFAVDGRFVRAVVDRVEEPGSHEAAWDGRDARGVELPAGVYFCRLAAGGQMAARKLLLIK